MGVLPRVLSDLLLCAVLIGCFTCTIYCKVQYRNIKDSRLCNNGDTPRYKSTLCKRRRQPEPEKGEEYVCDRREIRAEDCREAALEMHEFGADKLLELLPDVDSDFSIRRVAVKITNETIDDEIVGKEIDKFLTARLWWYVHKEPYSWNKHSHKIIILDRVQHFFEPNLRLLSALQYPDSKEICNEAPLLFNHRDFHHPGWYSMLAVFSIVHDELPYGITAMYISNENSAGDSSAFISAVDCPSTINKWECAFLPTTNCDLPELITHCHGDHCVQNLVPDTRWSTIIFDRASKDAKPLTANTPTYAEVKARGAKEPSYNHHFMAEKKAFAQRKFSAEVQYLRPARPELAPFQSMMYFDLEFYTYSFILRPSHFYRSKIQETIHSFRTINDFSISERCVAAQIRRGDRTMKGINITEYCLNTQHPNTDMGCETVPFASVTLTHVIDSAEKLVDSDVRKLIVSTDDEEWLNEQKKEIARTRPEWTVYNLRGPMKSSSDAGTYEYMRSGAGTASGVLLYASIELSRQCEAFVGHFGCGGTMLIYKSMCAQHNHREYVCPPSFDVRTIPELQIPHLTGESIPLYVL